MTPVVTGAAVFRSTKIVTAAEIHVLDTTPVLLTPPVPGKTIMPVAMFWKYNFGTELFVMGQASGQTSAFVFYDATGTAQVSLAEFAVLINQATQNKFQIPLVANDTIVTNLAAAFDRGIYLIVSTPGFDAGAATAATVDPANKGLLYALNDTGTIQSGEALDATYTVTGVGAGGLVTTVTVAGGGGIQTGGPFPTTVVSGSGDGTLELTITAIRPQGDGTVEIDVVYQTI